MARKQFTPQDLQQIQELAAGWGKIIAKRAFGEQGPGLDADLSALEAVAAAAARGLTQGTLTTLLQQQAQTLGSQQPCPACGTLCPITSEARPLHVQGGQAITYDEPLGHCPACRRDFFPPPTRLASGRTRLQPRRPGHHP
jgi:hypothetical protein